MEHTTHELHDSHESHTKKRIPEKYFIPGSILIAAFLVSGSLIYGAGMNSGTVKGNTNDQAGGAQVPTADQGPNIDSLRAVSKSDHIKGNVNAPVKLLLYSDLECPFCKKFHYTVQDILKKYGDKVAFVYRHLPLDGLHQKSRKEAEATECAAELGGNDKFFSYMDRLMELTNSNDSLDPAQLPKIATYVGLDETKFMACLNSGKYAAKVDVDAKEAQAAGIQGTPFSILIGKNAKDTVQGAYPLADVTAKIDALLK